MNSTSFTLVYDVTREFPPLWFPGVGLALTILGAFVWRYRHRMEDWWHGPFRNHASLRTAFAAVYLGFMIYWTSTATFALVRHYGSARRALRDGSASVVEGPVLDFYSMPYSGHDTERFTVQGVHFAYSDFEMTGGFRNSQSHGGPLAAGVFVRIHYDQRFHRPRILKLEIRNATPAAASMDEPVCR
jgi:amino acid transporter